MKNKEASSKYKFELKTSTVPMMPPTVPSLECSAQAMPTPDEVRAAQLDDRAVISLVVSGDTKGDVQLSFVNAMRRNVVVFQIDITRDQASSLKHVLTAIDLLRSMNDE